MAAVKQYQNQFVQVKYHPKENVINLIMLKKGNPQQFFKVENQIKTSLAVDSTNQDAPNSKIIKLTDSPSNSETTVHEFLQSMLGGGSAQEDAESSQEEQNAPETPPPSQVQVTPEGRAFKAFETLLESTYRTGEYWDDIVAGTGKSKQTISPEDLISSRKVFGQKKQSPQRDKVLRALDKAMKYFARKLRLTMGPEASRVFKKRFRTASDLTPSDYSEPEQDDFDINDPSGNFEPQDSVPQNNIMNDPQVALASKKISKLFK